MSGVDWNTISTTVAVILAIAVGYLYPKIRILNKTIVLKKTQVEKVKGILDMIEKAISDGKITPDETKAIVNKIKSVFETNDANEIEEIIKLVMSMIEKEG